MKQHRHVLYPALILIALALAGLIQSVTHLQAQEAMECVGPFEATVHQGPNAGLSLVGELQLAVEPSGHASGMLTGDEDLAVNVVGQVSGRAINLVFTVAEDRYVFGVGTSLNDFSECDSIIGGPLVGPQVGDSGDWGYALGGYSLQVLRQPQGF